MVNDLRTQSLRYWDIFSRSRPPSAENKRLSGLSCIPKPAYWCAYVVLVLVYQCHPYLDIVVLLMMIDEKKNAVEIKSRTHLEMDEIEELLELARKTDERSWCILTLAFNHGLRVSECAGGASAIPGKTRPAIPPLMLSDIDMRHRTIRVRRLKGSLETTQAFVEHRGKPALSDYACLKTYLAVRTNDGSDFLFTGQKGPLHRWALNRMFVELLRKVSDARVVRGLQPIPQGCFRFHTLKHSVATIIANRVQNIFTLKNHLGHASISSSMSYAHPDSRATAAQVQHALSIAFSGF